MKSTPATDEYGYNYWLLQKTYLYEEELPNLPEEGDSIQVLYKALSDRYTRYTEPSQSAAVIESRNTSVITGDIGLEFWYNPGTEHTLSIRHVYPKSPADRAGVPKNGVVISVNGTELTGEDAYQKYRAVFDSNEVIVLEISFQDSVRSYTMKRETIYAPTIFVDTVDGYEVINIREFKLNTIERDSGSYMELKRHLDSTASDKSVRILDLRNNPGGHVDQCIKMADLFVKSGTLSSRHWYVFSADGKRTEHKTSNEAKAGDSGEEGKFVMLANTGSASCAEIFAAAVRELTDIPLAGITTFGKGIGQSSWKTMDGGLATITTLEFFTPKGNLYHGKGLEPDYPCTDGVSVQCAIDAAQKHFGKALKKTAGKAVGTEKQPITGNNHQIEDVYGGAYADIFLFK
ncbi:MAG: peptidase S41 [Fibrobacter sp.]|uniref:S41 family peptidase n=1 Tax=Fibrobacter sp. TaxID=35828 RepID=UPI0025C5BF46|nr:S41 family peptidase [Fibrobacter sp.]MBR4784194.1 peptidase S41 [Fibrobacter sp.]